MSQLPTQPLVLLLAVGIESRTQALDTGQGGTSGSSTSSTGGSGEGTKQAL